MFVVVVFIVKNKIPKKKKKNYGKRRNRRKAKHQTKKTNVIYTTKRTFHLNWKEYTNSTDGVCMDVLLFWRNKYKRNHLTELQIENLKKKKIVLFDRHKSQVACHRYNWLWYFILNVFRLSVVAFNYNRKTAFVIVHKRTPAVVL